MAGNPFFTWPDGFGWIVLSASWNESSSIRAQAIGRSAADGVVAYVSLADDTGDLLLEDMVDLGAPSGYIVDIVHENDETIYQQLREASIVVIQAGDSIDTLHTNLRKVVISGILEVYIRGAVILLEGVAASIFGRFLLNDTGLITEGLSWVKDAYILTDTQTLTDEPFVREILSENPLAVAIGIGSESALALGPEGQVEVWGLGKVTVSLGSGYKST